MKSNKDTNTARYKQIMLRLGDALNAFSVGYAMSMQKPKDLQGSFFALSIIKNLLIFPDILNYLNQINLQNLRDSIETHADKYMSVLREHKETAQAADDFSDYVQQLLAKISTKHNNATEKTLSVRELESAKELISTLLQKCKVLFAEQTHNQEAIDKLLSMTIAFNVSNLPVQAKMQLRDKLLLHKELWQPSQNLNDNFLLGFYQNNAKIIQNLEATEPEQAANEICKYLIDNNILQSLSDEKLITLYDRNRNIDPQTPELGAILQKVHNEAQLRYSYNRLSDSGYELLKRFQSFDAIIHQIENSEFALVETFLLRNENFNHEVLMVLAKHADNIKAVGSARNSSLTSIINHISANLEHHKAHLKSDIKIHSNIASVKAKLATSLEPQILKRYVELDKFTVNCLRDRYTNLYENIKTVNKRENTSKDFLNQTIVKRLAQDYHVTNLSNSVAKLRAVSAERTQIMNALSSIDFVDLFDSEHLNHFVTLNFRKQIASSNIKSSSEYIDAILKIITRNCSAAQLESLYKPLMHKELSSVEQKIKQEVQNEIKNRTSLSKMIYSLFAGKKNEYRKLRQVKQNFEQINSGSQAESSVNQENQEEVAEIMQNQKE